MNKRPHTARNGPLVLPVVKILDLEVARTGDEAHDPAV